MILNTANFLCSALLMPGLVKFHATTLPANQILAIKIARQYLVGRRELNKKPPALSVVAPSVKKAATVVAPGGNEIRLRRRHQSSSTLQSAA